MTPEEVERRQFIERQVAGALRSTIAAHGPITKTEISSASKRIVCQVEAAIKEADELAAAVPSSA